MSRLVLFLFSGSLAHCLYPIYGSVHWFSTSLQGRSYCAVLETGCCLMTGMPTRGCVLPDYRITANTVLCYCCGLRSFRELTYQYRQNIPASELPGKEAPRPPPQFCLVQMGICVPSGCLHQQGADWAAGLSGGHACSQAVLDPELAQALGLWAATHVSKTGFAKTACRQL